MKNPLLLIFLLFTLFGFGNLTGQELTEDNLKEIEAKFFGNEDLWQAEKLAKSHKPIEARNFYEKAISNFEEKKQWEGFVKAHSGILNTWAGSKDFKEPIVRAKAAITTIDSEAPELKYLCHSIYYSIARVCYEGFQYPDVLSYSDKAIDLIQNAPVKIAPRKLANTYIAIGAASLGMYDIERSANAFETARKILTQPDCGDCTSSLGYTYSNLGVLYGTKQNYDKALDYLEKGLEVQLEKSGPNSLNVVGSYHSLFDYYFQLEEYPKAVEYGTRMIFLINESKTTSEYYLGKLPEIYRVTGASYFRMYDNEKAHQYFEKAIEAVGDNELYLADKLQAYTGIGTIYSVTEEYEKGIKILNEVSELLKKLEARNGRPEIQLHLAYLHSIAGLYVRMKDFDLAQKYFKEGLAFYGRDELQGVPDKGLFYYGLASCHKELEQYDSAFYYNHEAILASCHSFNNPDFSQLPPIEDFKEANLVHLFLKQKTQFFAAAAKRSKKPEHRNELYSHALAITQHMDKYYSESIKKLNLLRGGEGEKLVDESIKANRQGIAIASDYYQVNKSEDILNQAFYFAQKMKAQQLWFKLLKSEASAFANIDKALLEQERDLVADINFYENMRRAAQKHGDIAAADKIQNEQLFKLKNEYSEFQKQLELQYPDYFESKYNFIPENNESLQAKIADNEMLLEYVLSDSSVFAFTIAKNRQLQLAEIKLDEQTTSRIEDFKAMLSNSVMQRPSSREKFIKLSHQLYQQFIQPIENQLEGKEKLTIIGDGMTNYIPFEALLASNEVKPFTDLKFFIKDHEISYHYSSTLFAKAKEYSLDNNSGIYAFAPVYDNVESKLVSEEASQDNSFNSTLRAFGPDGNLVPLVESETETKSIIKLFKQKNNASQSNLALRSEATEAALKENLEKPYQFVHIAGHSFADLDNPKFSGIACFEETDDSKEDGTLYTGEIYNISSKADLVTLSSCESGFGKLEGSEGMLGLNRAFIYAGTPNVVFSLWKVYDKVSAELMVDFYGNILDGKNYSESLRAAKLNLLENETTAAPHFWSPYLLIGR